KHLALVLTRAMVEQLTRDLLERARGPLLQALRDAALDRSQIDEVLLVGGQTRMPAVQQLVRGLFGKGPYKGPNPDEVVAAGAAIQAAVLTGEIKDLLLLDAAPLTLGIETVADASGTPALAAEARDGLMTPLIPRNTTFPTARGGLFTTSTDGQY